MKTRQILILIFLNTLLINCKKEKNGFTLNGKINEDYKGHIYLKYNNNIDSALVSNGIFEFSGHVQNPTDAVFYPRNPNFNDSVKIGFVGSLMLENSLIKTSLKYSEKISDGLLYKNLEIDTIIGSKSQKLRESFEHKLFKTVYNEKNDSIKKHLLFTNLYKFISDNPKSEMSGEYLSSFSRSTNFLNTSQIETLLKVMDTSYQNKNDLNNISKVIKQRKSFAIGKKPPELILPNTEDKLINRKSFNGKIVLLEFWASWCRPCRDSNPALVKLYDRYKDKDFEILGISIDKHKNDWKLAIKEDKLSWPQVIDSLRTTEKTYNLNSIPYNLLLNRKGEIIAQNIEPLNLEEILNNEL